MRALVIVGVGLLFAGLPLGLAYAVDLLGKDEQ